MAAAHDRLSGIASTIPPVSPEVLTLKQSALLAQPVLEGVVSQSTGGESYDHAVSSMRLCDSPRGKVEAVLKPSTPLTYFISAFLKESRTTSSVRDS